MDKNEDQILDLIADVIARFIIGSVGAITFLAIAVRYLPVSLLENWKLFLSAAFMVGLGYAAFGLRKGPGFV